MSLITGGILSQEQRPWSQDFHKVERFVKALDKKPSPGPFQRSVEGEKRIIWGIHSGGATVDTPNPEKTQGTV